MMDRRKFLKLSLPAVAALDLKREDVQDTSSESLKDMYIHLHRIGFVFNVEEIENLYHGSFTPKASTF